MGLQVWDAILNQLMPESYYSIQYSRNQLSKNSVYQNSHHILIEGRQFCEIDVNLRSMLTRV